MNINIEYSLNTHSHVSMDLEDRMFLKPKVARFKFFIYVLKGHRKLRIVNKKGINKVNAKY